MNKESLISNDKYYKARNVIEWFLCYSVLGWLYEVVYCMIIDLNLGFINRGFLFGPWLPIYGFGMLAIIFCFKKFKITNSFVIFICGAAISVTVELIGSYIMESIFGSFLWDYSDHFMNFEGRVALKPALRFGLLVYFAAKGVQPKMEDLQERYKNSKSHNLIFLFVCALFIVDLVARFWLGSNLKG